MKSQSRERQAVLLLLLIIAVVTLCIRFVSGGSDPVDPADTAIPVTATAKVDNDSVAEGDSVAARGTEGGKTKRKKSSGKASGKTKNRRSDTTPPHPKSPLDNRLNNR